MDNKLVKDMTFEELLTNLKLDALSWYRDDIPEEFCEVANHLYKVRNFFKEKDSQFIKDVDNHVLNTLLLLRNTLSEETKK